MLNYLPHPETLREYIEGKKGYTANFDKCYLTRKNTVEWVYIDDILYINQELEEGWLPYICWSKGELNLSKYFYEIQAYLELKKNGISAAYINMIEKLLPISNNHVSSWKLKLPKNLLPLYPKFSVYYRHIIANSFKPDEIKDYLLKEKYVFLKNLSIDYLDVLQEHPKFSELVNYHGAFKKYPQYLDVKKVVKKDKQILEILKQKDNFELIKKKVDWNKTVKGKIPLFIGYLDNNSDSEIIEFVAKNTEYNLLLTKYYNEKCKNRMSMLQYLADPERFRVLEAVYKFKEN